MKTTELGSLLKLGRDLYPGYEHWNVAEIRKAAMAWVGAEAAKARKDELLEMLARELKSGGDFVDQLESTDRQVLEVVARHGGSVSGEVLSAEMHARGLAAQMPVERWGSHPPTKSLTERLLLIPAHQSWGSTKIPDVMLPEALRKRVQPAEPLALDSALSLDPEKVRPEGARSGAEVLLDLLGVHDFLCSVGGWKPLRGGAMPKGLRNRLAKRFGKASEAASEDPMVPPDLDSLYFGILCELGLAEEGGARAVPDASVFSKMSAEQLSWHCAKAWKKIHFWQDGIGVVPEAYDEYDPHRMDFDALDRSRGLLAWGLSRLAHGGGGWVDLESFLLDLRTATKELPTYLYVPWAEWEPKFPGARDKDKKEGEERQRAYWLSGEGMWIANALMVTFHALGLVERGVSGKLNCFRLTPGGRVVFGTPQLREERQAPAEKFLIVQPNFDVVIYLRDADFTGLQEITPFLRRGAGAAARGEVQTFRLERENVYEALESGLPMEEIRRRLEKYSREPLPQLVERALAEWSGKRESLVLRKDVCIVLHEKRPTGNAVGGMRELEPGCELGSKSAAASLKRSRAKFEQVDHRAVAGASWTLGENGEVELLVDPLPLIPGIRLRALARKSRSGWKLTPASVKAAQRAGIPVVQMIEWLEDHADGGVPRLLVVAMTHWARSKKCFVGKLDAFQAPNLEIFRAICDSVSFDEMIAGTIAPDWIVFRPEKAAAAAKLLTGLGLALEADPSFDDGNPQR